MLMHFLFMHFVQVWNGTGTALSLLTIYWPTHELLVKMEKFVKKTFSSCVTYSRYGIVGAFSPPKGSTSPVSYALKKHRSFRLSSSSCDTRTALHVSHWCLVFPIVI